MVVSYFAGDFTLHHFNTASHTIAMVYVATLGINTRLQEKRPVPELGE
jgi:hypothetical protein